MPTIDANNWLVKWEPQNTHKVQYIVELKINDDEKYTEQTENPHFLIKGFLQGYVYAIRVATINSAGQGKFSDVLSYSEGKISNKKFQKILE